MTDDRKSGLALLFSTAGLLVVIIFHPTPGNFSVTRNIAVHSLALATIPVMFLGALGIYRRLASSDRLSLSGLVLYAFSLIAVMNAAIASGFLGSYLDLQVDAAESELMHDVWRALFSYNAQVNQAFAIAFVVASAAAILLWSIAILRNGALTRALGVYGCLIASFCVLGVLTGHTMSRIHGFAGLAFLGQAVWYFVSGIQLYNSKTA